MPGRPQPGVLGRQRVEGRVARLQSARRRARAEPRFIEVLRGTTPSHKDVRGDGGRGSGAYDLDASVVRASTKAWAISSVVDSRREMSPFIELISLCGDR